MKSAKQALRQRVWALLEKEGVARFPGARGRIPNFVGAERAAERLEELEVWQKARRIKANPDSAQAPARKRALLAGKTVYMAVPRLRDRACFIELDPSRLKSVARAATIRGAFEQGRAVRLFDDDEMPPVDLVLCGSVAVTRQGLRLGKGGGYSDLELGLLVGAGKIKPATPIVTTVHPLQIAPEVPVIEHDFALNFVVTPEEVITCRPTHPRPKGIYWDLLDPEKIGQVPVLADLARAKGRSR